MAGVLKIAGHELSLLSYRLFSGRRGSWPEARDSWIIWRPLGAVLSRRDVTYRPRTARETARTGEISRARAALMDDAAKIASPVVVESVIGALRVRHNAIIGLPLGPYTAPTSIHRRRGGIRWWRPSRGERTVWRRLTHQYVMKPVSRRDDVWFIVFAEIFFAETHIRRSQRTHKHVTTGTSDSSTAMSLMITA